VEHSRQRLDEELEEAIEANAEERSSADFKEGVRAFLERRRAQWPSRNARVS